MEIPVALARPGTCQILRLDYGYSPGSTPGWEGADLAWTPLEVSTQAGAPSRGLLLRNAEMLLGWARTRGGHGLWKELARIASSRGLCLVCRFPRRAEELIGHLRRAGPRPAFWENPADGRIPPLYEALSDKPGLVRFHLEYEWLTGLGAARGGAALLATAFALAGPTPQPAAAVGASLGITTGAARSYLSWMEDAALVRREGRTYALRHPLLAGLFAQDEVPTPRPTRTTFKNSPRSAAPSRSTLAPPSPPLPKPAGSPSEPASESAPPPHLPPRRPDPMDFD